MACHRALSETILSLRACSYATSLPPPR